MAAHEGATGWVRFGPWRWPGEEFRLQFRPDELHRVATLDDARIALARYLPRTQRRFTEPVILCHGLGANRFTWDLDARFSLARRLAERGFEAWILELRGRGEAGRAKRSSFDCQVEHDVTTALRTVLAATGTSSVTWVGHSKGGLLALAHLGRNPVAPIRAVATLGSPLSFTSQRGLRPFARLVGPALALPAVPIATFARLAVWVPPPAFFMRYLVHPENIDEEIRRLALVNVGADVHGGVGRQFVQWVASGKWTSLDRSWDYEKSLGRVRVPTLMIAGTRDLLAPPGAVLSARQHLAGPHEILIAGKDRGFKADYGHGDLVLGRHAPDELYPRVIAFLEANSTPTRR